MQATALVYQSLEQTKIKVCQYATLKQNIIPDPWPQRIVYRMVDDIVKCNDCIGIPEKYGGIPSAAYCSAFALYFTRELLQLGWRVHNLHPVHGHSVETDPRADVEIMIVQQPS